MRRVILLSWFVLGLGVVVGCGGNRGDALQGAASLAVPTALAQDNGGTKGCSIIGSWMTAATAEIQWIGTVTGQSSSSGEIIVDTPVWPFLKWNTSVALRGAWKRTGGNTFAFTQSGWVRGQDGSLWWLAKNFGTQTITDDCTKTTIVSTMEMQPLRTDIGDPISGPLVMEAYRIVVE